MMAVRAFVARILMVVLIVWCVVSTSSTGPVTPVVGKIRIPRAAPTPEATTTSPTPSPDQDSIDTTTNDSSDLLNNDVHYNLSQRGGVAPRDSDSETRHEMQEEREGSLLDDDTAETTETVSDELVTTELPYDGVAGMIQNATRSSIGALYTLYSLISYVAISSEENIAATKPKEVVNSHINSLYVLYSLVSYVVQSDASDEHTNEANGKKTTQSFTAANKFSALHQGISEGSTGDSEGPNIWTRYLIIAVCVVAAVILIIIVTTCMTIRCRRAKTHILDKRVVVCRTCSPSI